LTVLALPEFTLELLATFLVEPAPVGHVGLGTAMHVVTDVPVQVELC
jgi:hypothetical protein